LAINALEAMGGCELCTLIVPFNQQQKEEVERFVAQWVLTESKAVDRLCVVFAG
jgi:hypothetical protein